MEAKVAAAAANGFSRMVAKTTCTVGPDCAYQSGTHEGSSSLTALRCRPAYEIIEARSLKGDEVRR